ncbi:MAG: plasmid pRiA4b ORF-3 family protein [Nitrospirae bacterium]|nr:plasmid pRiA4b ORF-3 family protein [Magnetococcales bacterium]HAT50510.1 plasmid pRiA4b ORF-3 family protein [Alphaproteobacteria bacterium]
MRKLYHLRLSLIDSSPEIWRQLIVPADIPLDRLHDVFQISMGWMDCHLHEFQFGESRYTSSPESPTDGLDEGMFRLCDLAKRKGSKFGYLYDFGDSWAHHVEVEKTATYPPRDHFDVPIVCVDGKMTCPPEDVGGIYGYMEFREAMENTEHPRHAELIEWYEGLEWYGKSFNRDAFNQQYVNLELLKYINWSRTRKLPWES